MKRCNHILAIQGKICTTHRTTDHGGAGSACLQIPLHLNPVLSRMRLSAAYTRFEVE